MPTSPVKYATRCEECGAHESLALLAARMRYVGGHGYLVSVECADQVRCAERQDNKEAAIVSQTLAA